jgi:uncharacterized protein
MRGKFFNGYVGWIVLINVIAFLIATILGFFSNLNCLETICKYVALQPGAFLNGHFWTLLTSMFMHGGVMHLFVNMLSLVFVGGFVERLIGSRRFLILYLGSGLFAGLFHSILTYFLGSSVVGSFAMRFIGNPNGFAVGASGAIFALIGLLVLVIPNLKVYAMFIPIPIKMKYAGPGFLILFWLLSYYSPLSVGNLAHLGGLLVGLGYGGYLKYKYPRKTAMIARKFS